jgi:hypothetical protein
LGEESASRDLSVPVSSSGDVADTPVTLHVWDTPNGSRMLISLHFRCPQCQFPMHAPATQMGVSINELDSGLSLSMRLPISCSGHWEHVNEYGQTSGRQVKCGWQACIRDNNFHHPRCGGANFRSDFDMTRCTCRNLQGQ